MARVAPIGVESAVLKAPRSLKARSYLQTGIRLLLSERMLVIVLTLVGGLAHGWNMFNSPSTLFLEDEGIYTSQAWSILKEQSLTPYTYFYDHAPVGWILIAIWTALTGGFYTFGSSLDSGRVFMLLLHMAMLPMLYRLARKLDCSVVVAALVVLLFSISPLVIFYQRLILLDNIMMFWLLLSLILLLDDQGRLSRVILSGVCFALAMLCKETAAFLLPVMLFIGWQQQRHHEHQSRFGLGAWVVSMALVVSWYPLYALIKGELLPTGLVINLLGLRFDSGSDRASLLGTLAWQLRRGGGGMFNPNNDFWLLVRLDWIVRDAFLLVGGSIALFLNVGRGFFGQRSALIAGLLAFFPMFYMARGGLVSSFYLAFALPFLCLNLGILLNPLVSKLPKYLEVLSGVVITAIIITAYCQVGILQTSFTETPSNITREATSWIRLNVPTESKIVTNEVFWTDLHDPAPGAPAFPNIYSHWKVGLDPSVRVQIFNNDWRTVDYVLMLPEQISIFKANGNTVVLDALNNAYLVKRWGSKKNEMVELWRVNNEDALPPELEKLKKE